MHTEKYQSILANILQSGPAPAVEAAQEEPQDAVENGGETPGMKVYESVEKLKTAEDLATTTASEVSGIEIFKSKSGKVFLVSDKTRILPKHTLIGGYGTGKFFDCQYVCCEFSVFDAIESRMFSIESRMCLPFSVGGLWF